MAELRWAAGELGAVRDLEVVHGELWVASANGAVPGSVQDRLERHREQAGHAARRQVTHLLGSERYARLMDDLDALVEEVSWDAATPDAARERLRKDWRRLRRRATAADALSPGEDPELALHEVRKAAKRARYAAEALAPAFGVLAQQLAAVAEQVQDALGEHRDTLLTRGCCTGSGWRRAPTSTRSTCSRSAGCTPGRNGAARSRCTSTRVPVRRWTASATAAGSAEPSEGP